MLSWALSADVAAIPSCVNKQRRQYQCVFQASTNPLRVMVHHLRDEKYSATDDVIKVHLRPCLMTRRSCPVFTQCSVP